MTFKLTSISIHMLINKNIVERILQTHITTNSYEIKVLV